MNKKKQRLDRGSLIYLAYLLLLKGLFIEEAKRKWEFEKDNPEED